MNARRCSGTRNPVEVDLTTTATSQDCECDCDQRGGGGNRSGGGINGTRHRPAQLGQTLVSPRPRDGQGHPCGRVFRRRNANPDPTGRAPRPSRRSRREPSGCRRRRAATRSARPDPRSSRRLSPGEKTGTASESAIESPELIDIHHSTAARCHVSAVGCGTTVTPVASGLDKSERTAWPSSSQEAYHRAPNASAALTLPRDGEPAACQASIQCGRGQAEFRGAPEGAIKLGELKLRRVTGLPVEAGQWTNEAGSLDRRPPRKAPRATIQLPVRGVVPTRSSGRDLRQPDERRAAANSNGAADDGSGGTGSRMFAQSGTQIRMQAHASAPAAAHVRLGPSKSHAASGNASRRTVMTTKMITSAAPSRAHAGRTPLNVP